MKAYNPITLAATTGAFLALASCDRKQPSESDTGVEQAGIDSARTDEAMFRSEIERGLEELFNVMRIPTGEIEIMGGLSSSMERNDWKRKRFRDEFLTWLEALEQVGFVTLQEHSQSELDALGRMGARTFTVSPSEKTRGAADPILSEDGILVIRCRTCEVLEIVRVAPYESHWLPQSEEHRLVLGTYRTMPTENYKEMLPDEGESPIFKFRALLKLNPFTKRFTFVTADYGDPEKDDWTTENVP